MAEDQATREAVIRLEGKVDAYAAGQSARLDEVDRRLAGHDTAISDLRVTAATHVTRDELAERSVVAVQSSRPSGWVITGIVIAALALLPSFLDSLVSLIDKIAN